MQRALLATLACVASLPLFAACAGDREVAETETMGPSFAPLPAVCDTKDLSKPARDFFPKEYDKQGQDLLTALADACEAEPVGTATDAAFDVMWLMELALDGVSELDPVAGTTLVTGLLPFMVFEGCEPSGCVEAGFTGDILLALSERGAFAVRGGPADLTDDVVMRDAVEPLLETDPAVWGLRASSTWFDVLGQRALLYGHPETLAGPCDPATQDCPATDDQYDWKTLPDVDGFGDQMIVGACLHVDDAILDNRDLVLALRRNTTVLEVSALPFDACEFVPLAAVSLLERSLDFLSPLPRTLVAGTKKTGPGGNASDFSDFIPVGANINAELVFVSSPGDASFGGGDEATLDQVEVRAQTVLGTPLEFITVLLEAVDNNGAHVVFGGSTTQVTREEGGIATFDDLTLDKTGGYMVCATAVSDTYVFAEPVCSERFNVRPN